MFKIGDFSRLAQVSVRMLRHYDKLGLLTPSHIDRFTGYRYYTIDQLPRLHRIIALKDLGLSLEQIGQLPTGEVNVTVALVFCRGVFHVEQIGGAVAIHVGQLHGGGAGLIVGGVGNGDHLAETPAGAVEPEFDAVVVHAQEIGQPVAVDVGEARVLGAVEKVRAVRHEQSSAEVAHTLAGEIGNLLILNEEHVVEQVAVHVGQVDARIGKE